jgi:hypothetical protein
MHSTGMVLDHLALVMQIGARPSQLRRLKKVQWFEEKWVTKEVYENVVRESWNKPVQHGSPMFMLCQKITQCHRALCDWSHTAFGNNSS